MEELLTTDNGGRFMMWSTLEPRMTKNKKYMSD